MGQPGVSRQLPGTRDWSLDSELAPGVQAKYKHTIWISFFLQP
jgi:hypothetical protein